MNTLKLISLLPMMSACALLAPAPASAQLGGPTAKIATATALVLPATVARGGHGILVVAVSVKTAYHINANKPNDPAYIPTVFTPQPLPGVVFGPVHYPAAKLVKVSYSPKPLLVYIGHAVLTVPFTVSKSAKPGSASFAGSVAYQGCNAQSCFPPATLSVKAAVVVR